MLVLALCYRDHCFDDKLPSKESGPAKHKNWWPENPEAYTANGLSLSNEDVEQMLKLHKRCGMLSKMFSSVAFREIRSHHPKNCYSSTM